MHTRLDKLLQSMTGNEKRRIKRILNDDRSIMTTFADLPNELVAQIISYLDVDSLVAVLEVGSLNNAKLRLPRDNWYQEVCNAVVRGPFRTLGKEEGYQNLAIETSSQSELTHRYQWCLQAGRDYLERKKGLFKPKILKLMGPVTMCDRKYCNGRFGMNETHWVGEGAIKVSQFPSGDRLCFWLPDRSKPFCWSLSDQYLIALDNSRTRIYAWNLQGPDGLLPSAHQMPDPITKRLPSALHNRFTICGTRVGFILRKTAYMWDLIGNTLDTTEIRAHTVEPGATILFHPEDHRVVFLITARDSRCKGKEEQADQKHDASILLVRKYVNGNCEGEFVTENLCQNVNTVEPARADLSGAYVVGEVLISISSCKFVTFNPYTEDLNVKTVHVSNMNRILKFDTLLLEAYTFWEGAALRPEAIESLQSLLGIDEEQPMKVYIEAS